MKNYILRKFLVNKSGLIIGQNKDGRVWVEIRWAGKMVREVILRNADTWTERDLKKIAHYSTARQPSQ